MRQRLVWLLPLTMAVLGGLILAWGSWEQRRIMAGVEALFRAHVESVAALVREGARQAAIATALAYRLSEERMATTARLLALSPADRVQGLARQEELIVWLIEGPGGVFEGEWGPVAAQEREAFVGQLSAQGGILREEGLLRRRGLACLAHRGEGPGTLVCRDARRLSGLRREVGIGPLLKDIVPQAVAYVAIQDQEGVLAAALSGVALSSWDQDPLLGPALEGEGLVYRTLAQGGRAYFEGLGPFPLADGSTALLRVGVGAEVLTNLRDRAYGRLVMTALLVGTIVLLASLLAWGLWIWEERRQGAQRRLAQGAEESRHWRTIGQMAATVAHEVRNPLNTLSMVAQRLAGEFSVAEGEREEFGELLGLVRSESERVNRVVSEFLELGRPIVLRRERVEARGAVEEAVRPLVMRAKREGKALVLENRCRGLAFVDPERFHQMVANLGGNALDAVERGQGVWVEAQSLGEGLSLVVRDEGRGMEGERLAQALQPFFTTKPQGTGLGLPLVKRLAEAHGGSLTLESALGQGTVVRVVLPGAD